MSTSIRHQHILFPLRVILLTGVVILTFLQLAFAAKGLSIKTQSGETVGFYKGSHALLIGVNDYKNGWPDLESIPGDIAIVKKVLDAQNFQVEILMDPDADQLGDAFETFIDKYGFNRENRLLVYFAGHGHTMDGGSRGYLVPSDAPVPEKNPVGFKRKALDMNQIISWCRQIDAKHVLFIFDSCFSGTIFKQRSLPKNPSRINMLTSKPVRQFITAGSAGESVPAKSTFTPAFADAIMFGLADLNRDGYITGTELGIYLQASIPSHVQQTPQYGKISDYELSRGDFVFQVGSKAAAASSNNELEINAAPVKGERSDRKIDPSGSGQSPGSSKIASLPAVKKVLPDHPDILIRAQGDESLLPLYKSEIESAFFNLGLNISSVENIPGLKQEMKTGEGSLKWYEIKQLMPDNNAHILLYATINATGSMMLDFHGRQTRLNHADFMIKAVDLVSGKIVFPTKNGRFKYTNLDLSRNLQQAVTPKIEQAGEGIRTYWKKKLADQQ